MYYRGTEYEYNLSTQVARNSFPLINRWSLPMYTATPMNRWDRQDGFS